MLLVVVKTHETPSKAAPPPPPHPQGGGGVGVRFAPDWWKNGTLIRLTAEQAILGTRLARFFYTAFLDDFV
jgi:hypothetical protein